MTVGAIGAGAIGAGASAAAAALGLGVEGIIAAASTSGGGGTHPFSWKARITRSVAVAEPDF